MLFERGIDICHETVRLWWNWFGSIVAADSRRMGVDGMLEVLIGTGIWKGPVIPDAGRN